MKRILIILIASLLIGITAGYLISPAKAVRVTMEKVPAPVINIKKLEVINDQLRSVNWPTIKYKEKPKEVVLPTCPDGMYLMGLDMNDNTIPVCKYEPTGCPYAENIPMDQCSKEKLGLENYY